MSEIKIPIIIPAYQPNDMLLKLIHELKNIGITDIVIVDDGNAGGEYDIINKAEQIFGCDIVHHCVNLGKGRALKDAFNYCICKYSNLYGCVTADADGQHTPEDIYKCMKTLEENNEMLILGCRDFEQENVPIKSKLGNKITRNICKWFCGINVSDTQTGLRAIPKQFMEHLLNVSGERFEFETNMLLEAKGRCAIKEVTIQTVYDSKENHATHFDPIKDSIKIYKILIKMFVRFVFSSLFSCFIDLVLFSYFVFILKSKDIIFYAAFSTIGARIISAIFNYLINYKIVFKSTEKYKMSITKYFFLAVTQMLLSAVLVTTGIGIFHFLPEVGIKLIVDTFLFLISFVIQRRYIFKV